jgi:hypothetical protein
MRKRFNDGDFLKVTFFLKGLFTTLPEFERHWKEALALITKVAVTDSKEVTMVEEKQRKQKEEEVQEMFFLCFKLSRFAFRA